MDRRKLNKGTRGNNGGRPTKEKELQLIEKLSPLDDQAFNLLKEGIEKGDFRFLKLYFNYRFGRPREMKDINITSNQEMPLFEINFTSTEEMNNKKI